MELSDEPSALSDLIGRPVCDGSGRRLGRAFEVRAHWKDGEVVIDEILYGRGALLKRLRGPSARAKSVRWENVAEVGERLVLRA